jgi:hypothetical protein
MLRNRRGILLELAMAAIAGTTLPYCSSRRLPTDSSLPTDSYTESTPSDSSTDGTRQFSTGSSITDFLTPFSNYCSDKKMDEIDWVIGSQSPQQDITSLDNLAERFQSALQGCTSNPSIPDTQLAYQNNIITLGDPNTNLLLARLMTYDKLPLQGTGLIRTYRFKQGPEVLCLSGRTPSDRALAANTVYGALMGYWPATASGANVVECRRENEEIVLKAYNE